MPAEKTAKGKSRKKRRLPGKKSREKQFAPAYENMWTNFYFAL